MVASLSCTAEGLHWLWVLHSAIEKTMLKQARDNINALISFFQKEVSSGALTRQPQQQEVTLTPASLLLSACTHCSLESPNVHCKGDAGCHGGYSVSLPMGHNKKLLDVLFVSRMKPGSYSAPEPGSVCLCEISILS